MDHFEKICELMDQASLLDASPARTALIGEAVQIADVAGNEDLQFELRLELVDAAFWSGEADKMLVALSWCVAALDRNPEAYSPEPVLEGFSYALAYVSGMPSISRQQIEQLLDDYERRCSAYGVSRIQVHRFRCFNAFWMGDLAEARKQFQKMQQQPFDWHYPNGPWHRLFLADYHIQMGDFESAYHAARPTLEAPRKSEDSDPWMASFMLIPLLQLGKHEEAARCQRRAYPKIRGNPKYVELVGLHISYLAAVNQTTKGLQLLERHLNWAETATSVRSALEFLLGGWILCRRLQANGVEQMRLRLPGLTSRATRVLDAKSPPSKASCSADLAPLAMSGQQDQFRVSDLCQWFEGRVQALAQRFDERNGNTHFTGLVNNRLRHCDVD